MYIHKLKKIIVVKIITIILVGGFILPDAALSMSSPLTSTLAVQSMFKLMVSLVKVDGKFVISEDEETLSKIQGGFQKDAEIQYFNLLKDRAKEIGLSQVGLRRFIKEHLTEFTFNLSERSGLPERGEIVIEAHRGKIRDDMPENDRETLKESSADPRIGMIEFDVQLTKDGHFVVVHSGIARVGGMTLDELRKLHKGIPLFEDILDESLIRSGKKLHIDVKYFEDNNPAEAERIVRELMKLLKERRAMHRAVIGSFSVELLEEVRKQSPKAEINYYGDGKVPTLETIEEDIGKAAKLGASYISIRNDASMMELAKRIYENKSHHRFLIYVFLQNKLDDKFADDLGKLRTQGLAVLSSENAEIISEAEKQLRLFSVVDNNNIEAEETPWGQTFIDTALLRAYEARKLYAEGKIESPDILIGAETSWIPKEQLPYIQELLNKLSKLSKEKGMDNLIIRRRKGTALASVLRKEAGERGIPNSNVLILGDHRVLDGKVFDSFREGVDPEKWAFFAGVELPENFPENNYIRLLEMLTNALNLWSGKPQPADTPFMRIVQEGKRIYKFIIPEVEPMDYNLLKEIYAGQLKAMKAA